MSAARTFPLQYQKESPEFTGRVNAMAMVEPAPYARPVHVNVALTGPTGKVAFRDAWYAGTIEPDPTKRGTMRWQYRYPNGHAYPGLFATIREAVQPAILYAADIMARDLAKPEEPHA